eukprot:gene4254-3076_t
MLGPVKLASQNVMPRSVAPSPGARGHLCAAHGLLCNAMNWATAGRFLANDSQLRDCIHSITSLDMRNHGASPHTPTHTNAGMASDVELFALEQAQRLPATARQVLMGHSMGGLAVMGSLLRRYNEAALLPEYPEETAASALFPGWAARDQQDVRASMRLVNKRMGVSETATLQHTLFNEAPGEEPNGAITAAVLVDVTPTLTIGDDVRNILRAMCGVDMRCIRSYDDAQKELIRVGMDDKSMRDFFITNIAMPRSGPASWRCNLPVLAAHVDLLKPTITDWFLNSMAGAGAGAGVGMQPTPCTLPTLFVFGEKSVYNVKEMRERITVFFPNSQQVVIPGANHFVHHEKPKEFTAAIAPFLIQHMTP